MANSLLMYDLQNKIIDGQLFLINDNFCKNVMLFSKIAYFQPPNVHFEVPQVSHRFATCGTVLPRFEQFRHALYSPHHVWKSSDTLNTCDLL